MSPFLQTRNELQRKHVFVNLGDGTYTHSGLLSIRQAVTSEKNARIEGRSVPNMTFKILANNAVAMTGTFLFHHFMSITHTHTQKHTHKQTLKKEDKHPKGDMMQWKSHNKSNTRV